LLPFRENAHRTIQIVSALFSATPTAFQKRPNAPNDLQSLLLSNMLSWLTSLAKDVAVRNCLVITRTKEVLAQTKPDEMVMILVSPGQFDISNERDFLDKPSVYKLYHPSFLSNVPREFRETLEVPLHMRLVRRMLNGGNLSDGDIKRACCSFIIKFWISQHQLGDPSHNDDSDLLTDAILSKIDDNLDVVFNEIISSTQEKFWEQKRPLSDVMVDALSAPNL